MKIDIIGDGLAGLLLADRWIAQGHQATIYGDGRSQTPPLGLVHLFAGRTFRRSPLELTAFQRAMAYWQESPHAREHLVQRQVLPGDRLDRSFRDLHLPSPWAPRPLEEAWVQYGPGFAVQAQALERELRQRHRKVLRAGRLQPDQLPPGLKVLAVGRHAPDYLPELSWDISSGRTLQAGLDAPQSSILIGSGLHSVPFGDGRQVILGGRHSARSGELHGDEIALAQALTGRPHQAGTEWRGQRCSPMLDHRPVVGWLEEERFAFFGFGSRALFWLPYCVDRAVGALLDREDEPPELSPSRFAL